MDWSGIEADLAEMVGPSVRALVGEGGEVCVDAARVCALADELVAHLVASRGLDAASAEALRRSLGQRLLEVLAPMPVS